MDLFCERPNLPTQLADEQRVNVFVGGTIEEIPGWGRFNQRPEETLLTAHDGTTVIDLSDANLSAAQRERVSETLGDTIPALVDRYRGPRRV